MCQDINTRTWTSKGIAVTQSSAPPPLSRRERQIMDVVYRLESASAADIHVALPDPPTYTTVRGLLRILVDKGHLRRTSVRLYRSAGRRAAWGGDRQRRQP